MTKFRAVNDIQFYSFFLIGGGLVLLVAQMESKAMKGLVNV